MFDELEDIPKRRKPLYIKLSKERRLHLDYEGTKMGMDMRLAELCKDEVQLNFVHGLENTVMQTKKPKRCAKAKDYERRYETAVANLKAVLDDAPNGWWAGDALSLLDSLDKPDYSAVTIQGAKEEYALLCKDELNDEGSFTPAQIKNIVPILKKNYTPKNPI